MNEERLRCQGEGQRVKTGGFGVSVGHCYR